MAKIIERLQEKCRCNPRRVVLPETNDPRVLQAAAALKRRKLADPVLLADRSQFESARWRGQIEESITVIPNDDRELQQQCARQLYLNRKHKGLSLEGAQLAVSDPLLLAALMVKIGQADAAVAGSDSPTASVIRAGLYGIGTPPGGNLVSSFFLMEHDLCCWTFADCAVVPDPNVDQLARIAIDSAKNHQQLTGEAARVAMLSFSTLGSASHALVDKVCQAVNLVTSIAPEIAIDGELQFDAAMMPEIATRKAPKSTVAGQANVFIFPDLNAGNIGYKIAERLAGMQAVGPIIQGLSRPFMDLSRGCQVEDIVNVAVIASLMTNDRNP